MTSQISQAAAAAASRRPRGCSSRSHLFFGTRERTTSRPPCRPLSPCLPLRTSPRSSGRALASSPTTRSSSTGATLPRAPPIRRDRSPSSSLRCTSSLRRRSPTGVAGRHRNSLAQFGRVLGVRMRAVCRGAPCVLLNHRLPAPTLAAMAASAAVRRLIFSAAFRNEALHVASECRLPEPILLQPGGGERLAPTAGPSLWLAPTTVSSRHAAARQALKERTEKGGDGKSWAAKLAACLPHLEGAARAAAPGNVALVFFTSGSTGTPKPVPHTHAYLLGARRREAEWLRRLGLLGAAGERTEDCSPWAGLPRPRLLHELPRGAAQRRALHRRRRRPARP